MCVLVDLCEYLDRLRKRRKSTDYLERNGKERRKETDIGVAKE